jgi:hypothetical protein
VSDDRDEDLDAIGLEIAGFLAHIATIIWASLLVADMISGDRRGIVQDLAAIGLSVVLTRAMKGGFYYINRWRDRMLARFEEEHGRR